MAFDMDAQGNVDVYFTQRYGKVQRYNGAAGTVTTLADFAYATSQVPIPGSNPPSTLGLHGIALDPGFKTNRWVYLYSAIGLGNSTWSVKRYKLNGNALDLASARTIFEFTAQSSSQHMGGVVRFDHRGDLWVTVADNGGSTTPNGFGTQNIYLAANTNSPIGKILRIRPRPIADDAAHAAPGKGSTYDIPEGNLFPEGTPQTLPEIYVMGARNPYTLTVDSVRGGIAWSDIGPDDFPVGSTTPAQMSEEFNFTTSPGFYGWPYWAGNQIAINSGGGTPAAPTNTHSTNTGMTNLPPARPATIPYGRDCAVSGPVYYYNPLLNSSRKFPPHFHGKWFLSDFNKFWIDAAELDEAGAAVVARRRLFTRMADTSAIANYPILNSPLEVDFGPDGALYVVNYAGYRNTTTGTGILRIRYQGSCAPTSVAAERLYPAGMGVRLEGSALHVTRPGRFRAEIRDVSGRVLWSREGAGPERIELRGATTGSGVRILRVTGSGGAFVRRLAP